MQGQGVNFRSLIIAVLVGVGILLIPVPEGLDPKAWHLFAIFVATIVGIVGKALSIGGVAIIALAVTTLSGTLTIQEGLSGFSSPLIWLIVTAFFVARSFVKTGLGMRIAYLFVALLGKKSLGIAYGFAFTDLVLAPAIPSNTARAGGIIYPIVKSLALSYDSSPEKGTERKIGSFLIQSVYQIQVITCAMFLTSSAANPLINSFNEVEGLGLTWTGWFLAGLLPGLISILVLPYALFLLYPPEIKETPHAKELAKQHLKEMGSLKREEWITIGVFFLLLFLWAVGAQVWGINSTIAAMTGLAVLLLTRVLTWEDIKSEKGAWDTLIWFSVLMTLATYLNKLGFISWFSANFQEQVSGLNWQVAFPILLLVYFYSHYLFASITAHVSAMYAAVLTLGIAAGIPPGLFVLTLTYTSSLCASLTHYGTGPAPLLFGSRYVDLVTWWKLGGVISVINLVIWMGVGPIWWKVLGFW
ncbi:MAG: putative malate transporter YflS [Chlamydiae bacterium]|nr:putative malate transporter YflS [Chlamydiota bacterium]